MNWQDYWLALGWAGRGIAVTLGAVVALLLFMLCYTLAYAVFG